MKLFYLLVLLSFLIFSCGNAKTSSNNKLFEGAITYSLEYTPYSALLSSDTLKELLGSELKVDFKKGNYRKQYFSPGGTLLQERYLDLKEKKSYYRSLDSDTIYWFNITKTNNECTFNLLKDTVLFNYQARAVKTETTVLMKNFGKDSIKLWGLYYYSKKHKVNPQWYKDYNEDGFNEVIKYGKGISLLEVSEGVFWEKKVILKTVTPGNIEYNQIKIPINNKSILKEL